jgi:Gpi18-like mannosyltransferase
LTALLWWTVRRHSGSTAAAHWVALAYWANPATILNGEVLGYLDPLMMLPAMGMLVLLHEGSPAFAGAAFATALLTKPQAILLAPILVLAAWGLGAYRGVARAAAGGAATTALVVLPFALAGALPNIWLAFGSFYARRRHPLGQRRQPLVDRHLRAARLVSDPADGRARRLSGAGAPDSGG